MGWGLSNLFDPAGVFSGDKGDIVGNLLDPVGGTMENFGLEDYNPLADTHDDVNSWMDDMADTNSVVAQDRWKKVRDNPQRLAYTGGDLYTAYNPIGTRAFNKMEADDKTTPGWDMYGGKTDEDYQNAENRGINTANSRGLGAVGSTIGKGFLNAYTFGLGSTAMDSLNAYGYGDDAGAGDILKKGAKNYAINYLGQGALDYAGGQMPETGGYSEAGGGYVSNSDYGGTGGFNLGKTVGAGDYAPQVNAVGKAAASGAITTAAQGGNRQDIGNSALTNGAMTGVKAGANMAGNYLSNLYDPMPDTGTLGGNAYDEDGENSATLGGTVTPTQASANQQAYSAGNTMPLSTASTGPTERGASASPGLSDNVSAFIGSLTGGGGGKGGSLGDYGDLASAGLGLYNAQKQRRRLQEQQSNLQNLFSPNSPYAQMARQKMERQDAAAGRRSQYGNREVQLAALLADRQAQTMPQQQKYADAIGGYDNSMANIGIRGGLKLAQMYGRPQQQAPMMSQRGYDPYSNPMYFGGGEGE